MTTSNYQVRNVGRTVGGLAGPPPAPANMDLLLQPAKYYHDRSTILINSWLARSLKFRKWYNILALHDNLKQGKMESVIGSDPRTSYRLALELLLGSSITHSFPTQNLAPDEVASTSQLEVQLGGWWDREDHRNRVRGRKRWLREFNSTTLLTGWYSVFAVVEEGPNGPRPIAEIWSPADTFQYMSEADGLVEVVHSYVVSAQELVQRAIKRGWMLPDQLGHSNWLDRLKFWQEQTTNHRVMDYWVMGDAGHPINTVLTAQGFLKPPTLEADMDRIPVFTGPVGGLPDRGSITEDDRWRETVGEGWVSTAEGIVENFNRQMTFLAQILRDSAQTRWKEKARTSGSIVTQELLERNGAILRMGIEEDVLPLQGPAVPVEIQTQLFTLSNMAQRIFLPHALHGNIQGAMSAVLMGQIAGAAQHVLSPYLEALSTTLKDIDEWWLGWIRRGKLRPYDKPLPTNLPKELEVEVKATVRIPGDLINRANVARMLNPSFTLPEVEIADMLFPEITDPARAVSQARADAALRHPLALAANLVSAYEREANYLEGLGDIEGATRFRKLAKNIADGHLNPQGPQEQGRVGVAPQTQPGGQGGFMEGLTQ